MSKHNLNNTFEQQINNWQQQLETLKTQKADLIRGCPR